MDLALLKQAGADGVFRKHHARAFDFRTGHRLGKDDHLVEWVRPAQPALSPEELASLPETLTVREVRLTVSTPGFRPKQVVVVMTLLDPQRYSKDALAPLYRWRWSAAEVNLRHLKTTLKMDLIQVKTPEMAVKDLWIHLLTYNLLRLLMHQSAQLTEADPLKLSLQGIRQMFNQFCSLLALAAIPDRRQRFHTLLWLLAQEIVPLRPDRCEPRVLKRRPKSFPRMQQPRALLKPSLAD